MDEDKLINCNLNLLQAYQKFSLQFYLFSMKFFIRMYNVYFCFMRTLLSLLLISFQLILKGQQIDIWIQPSQYEELKNSTVIFLVRKCDEQHIDKIQKILDSNWTYSKAIAVPQSNRINYPENSDKYAFFELSSNTTFTSDPSRGYETYISIHFWLKLSMNPEGDKKAIDYYRVRLYPIGYNYYRDGAAQTFVDSGGKFFNWGLGHLSVYIKTLNEYLITQKKSNLSVDNDVIDKDLVNLKKDTLYIPDYLFRKVGKPKRKKSVEKYVSHYKFPYKVIATEELDSLLYHSDKRIYYIVFTPFSAHKTYTIYDSKTGRVILEIEKRRSNIRKRDFRKMSYEVENSHKITGTE